MANLTPAQAIRKYCKKCAGTPSDVKNCGGEKLLDGTKCVFYKYRLGSGGGKPSVKTIRKFCLQCMGKSSDLVFNCPSVFTCELYPFKMGKNPNYKMSKERIENLKESFKKAREKKNDRNKIEFTTKVS